MNEPYITHWIRVGAKTEEVPRAIFSGTKTKIRDGYVSLEELSNEIQKACNHMYNNGYEVISIIPIIRGNYDTDFNNAGWGYSVTDGVVITGKLQTKNA
ncbi:MAG: hypothetical protein GY795_02610 [Desulfobacterales bacterium]|nr:hypothetical protein [Desulfobacterales bacterium]